MKIEFPIRHVENNLIFNRNGDVWAYYLSNLNENTFSYTPYSHIIIESKNKKNKLLYKGFKLPTVLGNDDITIKENIKMYFEGFFSQVKRSVGLDPYSLIKKDIDDYIKLSLEYKDVKGGTSNELKLLDTNDLLNLIKSHINLNQDLDKGKGFLDLNNITISPYDEKTLYIQGEDNDLFIQYINVKTIDNISDILWLTDFDFPLQISIRSSYYYENVFSINIKVTADSYDLLKNKVRDILRYSAQKNIRLDIPFGEQFTLFYESMPGTGQINFDYSTLERNQKGVAFI